MIEPNEEGKFICNECGAELNIPESIPTPSIPKALESERLALTMTNVDCPNPECGKSFYYDKTTHKLTE